MITVEYEPLNGVQSVSRSIILQHTRSRPSAIRIHVLMGFADDLHFLSDPAKESVAAVRLNVPGRASCQQYLHTTAHRVDPNQLSEFPPHLVFGCTWYLLREWSEHELLFQ
jgi:hypothetical protein